MTKKTTFNRKGLINETSRVKELRNLRISYYSCLANALRETDDDEQIVCLTARACRQAGLPEEPCVQRTIDQDRIALSADEIRKIFRTTYTEKGLKPRSVLNQKERIARGISDFFHRRYELRYNVVKKIEEWRQRDGVYREWQQLNDRDLNRMTSDLMTFPEIEQSLRTRLGAGRMPTISELSTALAHHFQAGAVKGRRGWYMQIRH